MKLSQLQQQLVQHAHEIEIVWHDDWLTRESGYSLRLINSCGSSLLCRGGPIHYKTFNGAMKAAHTLRPDLFPFGITWSFAR